MKYSINLGTTGYTRHMTNSLLTILNDEDAAVDDDKGLSFRLEVHFEGVPVAFDFIDTGVLVKPEHMAPEDWQVLSDRFDEQVKDMVFHALVAHANSRSVGLYT